jgi:hypothetical protein
MNDIFDRLATMRAAAEARARRIHERSVALEARRRELHARMDALRHLTISPATEPAAEPRGEEPAVSVSAAA